MRVDLLFFLASVALLAGCQTASSYQTDENSAYYIVPAGTHVMLSKELPIQPYQLGAYIQNGKVLPNTEVQHYYPFCKFELYKLSDSARSVPPDDMTVTKTSQLQWDGAVAQTGRLHYAALSSPIVRTQMEGGYPPIQAFLTQMDLHSEKNPDVYRLTCAKFGYPNMDRHVTIAEIRRTLDPLFTLRLAGASR